MKRLSNMFIALIIMLFIFQFKSGVAQTVKHTEGRYAYETVSGDPLNARIYKLDNGLTVYLTVYKDEPRIQTYIPVRAGAKNDPEDATGLAHYLEHMLFKGTDKFGTKDWTKEKPLIDEIIKLYDTYGKTSDKKKRKMIYRQIDSVSGIAAKYAIANEYDKMMSLIGAKGTNAYTWYEQTVYVNDIPSNQLEKWLQIESERFRNPVMRLFHTELEAVYEEKNIGLDEDGTKAWEELLLGIFPNHQYGTQTTIGTIEHLKNPPLRKVIEHYNTYYVPNNMAICLSGDLDFDKTIELIDKYWGSKSPKTVPVYTPPVEKPITKPVIKEVVGPDAEEIYIGYRFPGIDTKEGDMVIMSDMILANSSAGLLDLNLNQQQKVLESSSFTQMLKDYSAHMLYGKPREGQKLEEVKDLLLGQIEKLKKGDFPDWLPQAVITDLKLSQLKGYESNGSRADAFVNSFIKGVDWDRTVNKIERLSKITKADIVKFANENYKDNYVVVYKRKGEEKNVEKVEKPEITPVEVNRQDQTDFLKTIATTPAENVEPVFVNYKEEITETKLKNETPVYYKQNTENGLFYLNYVVEIGSNNDKRIGLAMGYADYLGTSKYTSAELKQEFYKLGSSFSISSGADRVAFSLSGLNDNFDKSLVLFESFINDMQPDKSALGNLVDDILKTRSDNKLSQEKILWDAMFSYGKYGAKSPYTNISSESELKSTTSEELIALIKELASYKHYITYYGPESVTKLAETLNSVHVKDGNLKGTPVLVEYTELPTTENKVYFVNHDGMVQAEIILLSKKEQYNKEKLPYISMYNEYFGNGMSAIIFQELRESKALAYSTFSSFTSPGKKENSHYNIAYIGTQSDKLPEAMKGLTDILTDMPSSEISFNSAKDNAIQKIKTSRITKGSIISSYLNAKKLGLDYDVRKDIYDKIQTMTLADIESFQKDNIKNSNYTFLVLGDKKKLDMSVLEKYGKVQELSLEEIFGY